MRPVVRYRPELHADTIVGKLVRNPLYGGQDAGLNGWRAAPLPRLTKTKPGFAAQLRESVKREGFRNPILVYRTKAGLLLSFGSTRLNIAKELGVPIPAIVNDYVDRDTGGWTLDSRNWKSVFKDPPANGGFQPDGSFDYHYALERNRRHEWDPQGLAWVLDDDVDEDFLETEFPWLTK